MAFVNSFTPATRTRGTSFVGETICSTTPKRTASAVRMVLDTKPSVGFNSFGAATEEKTFTVTVLAGNSQREIQVNRETNLRRALLDNKVDVYTIKGKLTNCGGGGSCGTCLISVEDGMYNTNGRAAREDDMLSSNPDNWRLACRTLIHGDVTIRTKPKQ